MLNHATRYSGNMAFRVMARLTDDLGSLPEDLRALAFHAILPSLIATRRQALQAAAGAAHGGQMGAVAEADVGGVQGDGGPGVQGAVALAQGALPEASAERFRLICWHRRSDSCPKRKSTWR